MTITIIHGPQASGKTRRAAQLLEHFDGKRIIDDWNGNPDVLKDGDIALTSCPDFVVPEGAHVIDIVTAKAMLTDRTS